MMMQGSIAAKDERCGRTIGGIHVVAGEKIHSRQFELTDDFLISPRTQKGNDSQWKLPVEFN